jgi:hypothetical protein
VRSRRQSRTTLPPSFVKIAVPLAIAAVPAALVWLWWDARPRAMAENEAWTVVAPACPEMSQLQFSRLPRLDTALRTTAFDEVIFTRQTGAMACNRVVSNGGRGFDRHPVCQFSGPGALVVRSGRNTRRFNAGLHPATVAVEKGRISCVLDAHFHANAWPEESQPS